MPSLLGVTVAAESVFSDEISACYDDSSPLTELVAGILTVAADALLSEPLRQIFPISYFGQSAFIRCY